MTSRGSIPPEQLSRLRAAAAGVGNAAAELRAAVRAANQNGGSVRVIAAELGRSPQTIQKWLTAQDDAPPARSSKTPSSSAARDSVVQIQN